MRINVALDLRAELCRATRVGWFHLSQGIEVSIAAAMLHTRPLPTAPPCCIHFTSSPLSTPRTWILEGYSCPDGKRARTHSENLSLIRPSDICVIVLKHGLCSNYYIQIYARLHCFMFLRNSEIEKRV